MSLAPDAGLDEDTADEPGCGDDCPNVELGAGAGIARIPGTTWTSIGPFRGGRLDGIVIGTDPPEVGTMLVASPGGGVFRRRPGRAWTRVSDGLPDANVVHLEIDLNDPNRVWASTWNSLYYTEDFGDSWATVVNASGLPRRPLPVPTDAIDPKPFAQLRFDDTHRAVFYGQACGGLWWSLDGELFVPEDLPQFPGRLDNDRCLGTIAADPLTRRVIVSTLASAGLTDRPRVFRSTCAWEADLPCLEWERRREGLPEGDERIMSLVSLSPAFPGQLLALYARQAIFGEAWRFDGATWSFVSALPDVPRGQNQPRPLFFREGQLFNGNQQAVWSGDLGASWRRISSLGRHHVDHRAMLPARRFDAVWSTTDGEGNGSNDRIGNIIRWDWPAGGGSPRNARLITPPRSAIQAYFVGVVPELAGRRRRQLYVGTLDNESFCRAEDGRFSSVNAPGSGDVFAFAVHPTSPSVAYALDNEYRIWSGTRTRSAEHTSPAEAAAR